MVKNTEGYVAEKERVSFTLEKDIKDRLQKQADRESRTLSNYMNLLIKRALDAGLVGDEGESDD